MSDSKIIHACNSGRQLNIDLAKCSAIVFMILIHVYIDFHADLNSGFAMICDSTFGGFMSAPVFMCSMGIGMAYSRNQDPKKIILRGLNILVIGYLLNILRRFPTILADLINHPEAVTTRRILINLLEGDILQFAGLAFILFGILRKFHWRDTAILIFGMICTIVNTFIPAIETANIVTNTALGLLTIVSPGPEYIEPISCFPLLGWFIFVAFGYWFGNRLKNIQNLNRFYGIVSLPSLLLCTAGVLYEYFNNMNMMESTVEYYHMVLPDVVISLFYCMFCFGICHFICKYLAMKVLEFIKEMSNALNLIYLTHWIVIGIAAALFESFVHTETVMTIIAAGIIVFSTWFGIKAKQYIRKHPEMFQKSILSYL